MREPTILVENSYFNIVYDWALKATDQDEPAAKLISVFRYHHDNKFGNRVLFELVERAMKYRKGLREMGDWMPYSISYMEECLMNAHGKPQVIAARKKLLEIGFISDNVPDDIPEFYSRSHSWYRFEVDNIRRWIHTVWYPLQNRTTVYPAYQSEIREAITQITSKGGVQPGAPVIETVKAEPLSKPVDALCKFYIHIHGKNSSYILDTERKNRVKNMFKKLLSVNDEKQAVALCAQAIIGNVLSDFHQGKHPANMLGVVGNNGTKGKIFDDIGEHIFKTAKKFDGMIEHAEDGGVTSEIALEQFKEFVKGKPSRYAKAKPKTAQTAGKSQTKAMSADRETVRAYRNFTSKVTPFFFTNVPNKEILELCDVDENLIALGKGLVDKELMAEVLMDVCAKMRERELSEKEIKQMKEFAKLYCEMQELNK